METWDSPKSHGIVKFIFWDGYLLRFFIRQGCLRASVELVVLSLLWKNCHPGIPKNAVSARSAIKIAIFTWPSNDFWFGEADEHWQGDVEFEICRSVPIPGVWKYLGILKYRIELGWSLIGFLTTAVCFGTWLGMSPPAAMRSKFVCSPLSNDYISKTRYRHQIFSGKWHCQTKSSSASFYFYYCTGSADQEWPALWLPAG